MTGKNKLGYLKINLSFASTNYSSLEIGLTSNNLISLINYIADKSKRIIFFKGVTWIDITEIITKYRGSRVLTAIRVCLVKDQ